MMPGDRLDEMMLAKKYEVSRTPVREAIRALTAIGLVQNTGRQGAEVAQISISMLIEMFDIFALKMIKQSKLLKTIQNYVGFRGMPNMLASPDKNNQN